MTWLVTDRWKPVVIATIGLLLLTFIILTFTGSGRWALYFDSSSLQTGCLPVHLSVRLSVCNQNNSFFLEMASPGNEVRGHNIIFFSRPLPGIFFSSETVLIRLGEFCGSGEIGENVFLW